MDPYIGNILRLRPMITRAQVEEVFPRERWAEHGLGGKFGVEFGFGPGAQNEPNGIACDNIVEKIQFRAPFPGSISLYGFAIGMARADAESEISRLGLATMEVTHPEVRYLIGSTSDGFEIMLMFRKESLEQLTLAQPDHSKIMDARRAFWKDKAEKERNQRELAKAWQRVTDDDDAMLLTWARHCQPWDDSSPTEFMRYADWLRRADPDERHAA